MSNYLHGLIAAAYLGLAAIVGFGLYQSGATVEPSVAAAVSVAVMLAAGLVHQAIVRQRRERMLVATLDGVQESQAKIEQALVATRVDFRDLALATEQLVQAVRPDAYGDMIAEMRVIETLVRQISPEGAAAARRPGEAPALPPVLDIEDDERLLDIIRGALTENRVDVYLQPVVSLPQRKPGYYETFTRLRAADGGLIEPARYIPVAERAGLITAIDNNLLFRCAQLVRKGQRHKLDHGFFCNLSPFTLRDGSFFPEFTDFMEQNARLAGNLIFEFAQADFARHDTDTARGLGRLSELGFRFSVDRVESFDIDIEELVERHISFVKMDARALIDWLGDADAAIQLDRVKRGLARAGIKLIVEKIEQEEQLVELLEFGIDFGQGYLFGAPRPSRED